MAHGHDRDHAEQGAAGAARAFAVAIALNAAFVVVEATFGVLADSMSLLADAGHNLGDVLALALAWGATMLSRREPSARFTYGLRGTSIFAAVANAMLLLLLTGGIAWEAAQRLVTPALVAGRTMIVVALVGIAINGGTAMLFARGRKSDLNVRAAFLHMAGDAAVSLGVAVAGAAILVTGWLWLDPLVGLIIAAAIVAGTWGLLRDSMALALNAVPGHIDPLRVRAYLSTLAGVAEVHDLHIWGMSTTETALTAHLVMPGGYPGDAFMPRVCAELEERFGVHHATIQIESGAQPCALAPDHVV